MKWTGLSDRIVIMDKGKSIVSGTSQELKKSIATSEIIKWNFQPFQQKNKWLA